MWIWIGVGLWLACGLLGWFMVRNAWLVQGWWERSEGVIFGFMALFGPIFPMMALLMEGKNCFKRRNKMKIYYDEKELQIKGKYGMCLLDMAEMRAQKAEMKTFDGGLDDVEDAVEKLKSDQEPICKEITTLKAQLQCGAKGHGKWVYTNSNANGPDSYRCIGVLGRWFVFKCQSCGLEITKRKKEITAKEKEGLTKLGLL